MCRRETSERDGANSRKILAKIYPCLSERYEEKEVLCYFNL